MHIFIFKNSDKLTGSVAFRGDFVNEVLSKINNVESNIRKNIGIEFHNRVWSDFTFSKKF